MEKTEVKNLVKLTLYRTALMSRARNSDLDNH